METFEVVLSNGKLTTIERGEQLILSDIAKESYRLNLKIPSLIETIFVFDSIAGGAIKVIDQNGDSHILASERFVRINLDQDCVILKPKNLRDKKYIDEILVDLIYTAEYDDEYGIFIFPEERAFILDLTHELDLELNHPNYELENKRFCLSPYFVY
jgi:hypothetical protein